MIKSYTSFHNFSQFLLKTATITMAEEIKMEILVVFQGHSCYTIAGNRKVFFVCFFSSSWIMAYLQLTCL